MKLHDLRIGVLAALMLATTVQGAEFNQLNPTKSAVTFAYKQMGVGMNGRFRKFDASVAFDPVRPDAATAH
jgi:polyisoprenoid-binding protein YceI